MPANETTSSYTKYRDRKRALISERKSQGCQVCRYKGNHRALEFHHVDPSKKVMTVNQRLRTGSLRHLVEELDRCVVLCANCHRNVHAGEINLEWLSAKKGYILRVATPAKTKSD